MFISSYFSSRREACKQTNRRQAFVARLPRIISIFVETAHFGKGKLNSSMLTVTEISIIQICL